MGEEVSDADNDNGGFMNANNMTLEKEMTSMVGVPKDISQSDAQTSAADENAPIDATEEPYEGMVFKTAEDAMQLYNLYAYRTGFSIRKASHYMSKKKEMITMQLFVCSREGQYKPKSRKTREDSTPQKEAQTMRTGCKACLKVVMEDQGRWEISKFNKEHNHILEANPSKARFFRSHRKITEEQMDMIHVLDDQNISSGQIMSVVASQHGGVQNVNFTRKDLSNKLVEIRHKLVGVDVASAIKYFKELQAKNPSFYYDIKVDDDNTARNLFWVDGRSRIAYQNFGDVVTFDTTYMTNKYGMPFAPFIGVNHHRQSILFGCALIRNENAESFKWLFETWLEAMFGKHPKAIITDQDLAMKKAIADVFPNTRHRCCQWHIMRKARDHLGVLYSSKEGFQVELKSCINDSLTVDEFKMRWKLMIETYGLQNNSHLNLLYSICDQWVPAFFRDTFFADMSTSQRSESMNALFKEIVDCHTSIYQFVIQYEKAVESRFDRENEEDFRTSQVKPSLWSAYPIEKHAREVYTRTMYKLFKEQLKATSSYDLEETETVGTYRITKLEDPKKPNIPQASYIVTANASSATASCNCKMFQFNGLLCSHVLKILIHLKIHHIPSHYILKRWTRNANDIQSNVIVEKNFSIDNSSSKATRFNSLCKKMLKIASEASTTLESYEFACGRLDNLIEEIISVKKNTEKEKVMDEIHDSQPQSFVFSQSGDTNANVDDNLIKDPPQSQCKGRRKVQRYKHPTADMKKSRTCKGCHRKGHNIRTCKEIVDVARSNVVNDISEGGEDEDDDDVDN